MGLNELLSVQKPTDTALLEAPSSRPAMPLTPPSDSAIGLPVTEEDLSSSAAQGKPINSSSVPPENDSTEAPVKVAAEDPIVFIDPLGTRWILPFETAKTLEVLLSSENTPRSLSL